MLKRVTFSLFFTSITPSNDSASNSSEYKIVLDENYDGYGDDNDLTSAEIDEGAENFAQCENATECSLLWDTAKEWLTEKSTYKSELETNTRNLLETKVDPRKKKADKITFKVSRIPSSKIFFFMRSAKLKSIFFRLFGAILDQEPFSKTSLAAITALFMSSTSHSAILVIIFPSTGLILSKVLPEVEST